MKEEFKHKVNLWLKILVIFFLVLIEECKKYIQYKYYTYIWAWVLLNVFFLFQLSFNSFDVLNKLWLIQLIDSYTLLNGIYENFSYF